MMKKSFFVSSFCMIVHGCRVLFYFGTKFILSFTPNPSANRFGKANAYLCEISLSLSSKSPGRFFSKKVR